MHTNFVVKDFKKFSILFLFDFRAFTKGNIINWDLANWDISNMQLKELNYSAICTGDKNELEVFYNQDFETGKVLCKALGGKMNVITDAKNNNMGNYK